MFIFSSVSFSKTVISPFIGEVSPLGCVYRFLILGEKELTLKEHLFDVYLGCGALVIQPGIEPRPSSVRAQSLTTGWLGNSLPVFFFFFNLSDWRRYKTLLILSVGKDVRRYCTNVNQWQLINHSTSWKAVYRNAWTYAETCPRILTSVIYSTKNWKQSKYQ